MTASMIDEIRMMFEAVRPGILWRACHAVAQLRCRCAQLAKRDGCSDSLVAAALLHDIGPVHRRCGQCSRAA